MKRILAVNPFGIGDVIFTLRVLEGLKNSSEAVLIDFVGNERTADLLRAHTALHHVYLFNRDRIRLLRKKNIFAWAGEYKQIVEAWRSRKYDVMLDYSLGREFSFLGKMAGIPVRAGLDFKRRGVFLTHKIHFSGYDDKPVFEEQARLLKLLDLPASFPEKGLRFKVFEETVISVRRFLREFGVAHGSRLVLAPGGGKSWGANARFKQWEAARFADVCNLWIQDTGGSVVILGDEDEKSLVREVMSAVQGRCATLIGASLPEVMGVMKECHLFLGNDGGMAHLAHALGLPAAVIFGPVDEKVYAPTTDVTPLFVITEDVPCRPCYRKFHFPPCPNERACLESISVDKVYQAIKKIA